jgi:hypothetical protein
VYYVAAEPADDAGARILPALECCGRCGSDKVHPVDWDEIDDRRWRLERRCPECEWRSVGEYDQAVLDRYDDVLLDATGDLLAELERVTRENMEDEIRRFVAALDAGHVVPDDF